MILRSWLHIQAACLSAWITASPCAALSEPGMVRIPGGELILGSKMEEILQASAFCSARADDAAHAACSPEEFTIELSSKEGTKIASFLLDRVEVSVADYQRCVDAGRCNGIDDPRKIEAFFDEELPVVFVTQKDATAYCHFRGARLPTEAEIEFAIRGRTGRLYPWGNDYHRARANAGRTGVRTTDASDGYEMLAPAKGFPAGQGPHGALQLAGNASEWTSSIFGAHGSKPSAKDSKFVVKGGSFTQAPVHLRGAARRGVAAATRAPDIGFRCAKSVRPSPQTEASR